MSWIVIEYREIVKSLSINFFYSPSSSFTFLFPLNFQHILRFFVRSRRTKRSRTFRGPSHNALTKRLVRKSPTARFQLLFANFVASPSAAFLTLPFLYFRTTTISFPRGKRVTSQFNRGEYTGVDLLDKNVFSQEQSDTPHGPHRPMSIPNCIRSHMQRSRTTQIFA